MSEQSEDVINEATRHLQEYARQLEAVVEACKTSGNVASVPNDGGPAFPHGPLGDTMHGEDGREWHQYPAGAGMSLRDWLAAHESLSDFDGENIVQSVAEALAGPKPMAGDTGEGRTTSAWLKFAEWEATWRAKLRYIRADAMIKAGKAGSAL